MTGVDDELRMLIVEMNQEANLTTRNRNEKRVHRVINRYPSRFLRQAARKAFAGEFLNEDEFVLTHLGYLPEEWNANLESEWSVALLKQWAGWSRKGEV